MVLLKNDGILPLNKAKIKTVGVIGPNANSRASLIGNYHGTSSEYITILEGIKQEAAEDIRVFYSEGSGLVKSKTEGLAYDNDRISEAVIVAEQSDVVILCLGLDESLEGEEGDAGNNYASGDKVDLQLPEPQRILMEAVAKVGKPTILCLTAGSAIDLSFAKEHFDAILLTWYPGARGGSRIAKTVFGKSSPSGKLPITFYNSLEELPAFEDYSMAKRTYRYISGEAMYPFGYGLTYGNCVVKQAKFINGKVEVDIENIGTYDTGDVVQVYIKNKDSEFAVPNHSLCAFQRVFLKKGESTKLELPIRDEAFFVVNEEGKYVQEGSNYTIYVGFGQPDTRTEQLYNHKCVSILVELV
ncbi:MAG: Beta-glucosidase [Herbinix sp.]|nr:Beta-glucosidase [Herbinix sp.]